MSIERETPATPTAKDSQPACETNAGTWERELADYRKEFINSQGWNDKQAASYIRDAWVCWRDWRLAISLAREKAPAGALPVFQHRTPLGWQVPLPLRIHVFEKLRLQRDDALVSMTPREQVFAMIAEQGAPPGGSLLEAPIKESELKRIIAQQAARNVLFICDSYESEPETAEACFWQAILAAFRFGRRQLLSEIYADEEVLEENMRGRLMNRKGKTAKRRKSPESPFREFRRRAQSLVHEGARHGRDAHTMLPFVIKCLRDEGMVDEGANFLLRDATARKETLSKWVREEFRKLRV